MQSLYNKRDDVESFLREFSSSKLLAICVSETWLSPAKIDLIQFHGYKLVASYNRRNHNGGGVCIILKDNVEHIERQDIERLTIEHVLEICAVEIVKFNIVLVTIYWNGKGADIFYSQIKTILEYIQKNFNKKKIIMGGDFNVNVLANSKESKRLLNLFLEYNFKQQIKEPTRVTKTSSTCLDLIFTNFSGNATYSVQDFGFSDHKCSIMHLTDITTQIQNKPNFWYITKRNFSIKNMNKFKTQLQKIEWLKYISMNNTVDDNYNSLNNILYNTLEQCIPKKRIKLNNNKNNKLWLTRGIKISCKNKRLLKIHAKYSKNKVLLNYCKTYESILKRIIKNVKKQQYINKMKKSTNKTKCMWQIIKERTNKFKKK